jgi:hypothetical protein
MQSVDLAERYRREDGKFIELARGAPPGAFRDVFQVSASTVILAVALAAVFVAGTIRVEECRIVPGAFASDDRRVCERSALALVLARKVDGAIRSNVLR